MPPEVFLFFYIDFDFFKVFVIFVDFETFNILKVIVIPLKTECIKRYYNYIFFKNFKIILTNDLKV